MIRLDDAIVSIDALLRDADINIPDDMNLLEFARKSPNVCNPNMLVPTILKTRKKYLLMCKTVAQTIKELL